MAPEHNDVVKLTGRGWRKYVNRNPDNVVAYGVYRSKGEDFEPLICPIDENGHVTWWGVKLSSIDPEEYKFEATDRKAREGITVCTGDVVIAGESK